MSAWGHWKHTGTCLILWRKLENNLLSLQWFIVGTSFSFLNALPACETARMPWVQSGGKTTKDKNNTNTLSEEISVLVLWGKTCHFAIINYPPSTHACLGGKFNHVIAHYHLCTTFPVDASLKLRDPRCFLQTRSRWDGDSFDLKAYCYF